MTEPRPASTPHRRRARAVRDLALRLSLALGLGLTAGCGGGENGGSGVAAAPVGAGAEAPASTADRGGAPLAPLVLDPSRVAAPVTDLLVPTGAAVLLRAALVKSEEPPTDAWDASASPFARAFCIGESCFSLVDRGERAPPETPLVAVGAAGSCEVAITRARLVRAHLAAHGERPAVEQAFALLEVGSCAAAPENRPEAIFGARPVDVLALRDLDWRPAPGDTVAALDAREEVNRALSEGRARVPLMVADVPRCGITLARGLAVYWLRDGVVNQPFDAARFISVGESLYAFSYVEGLDPLLERLDRVRCAAE